ncbi:MAG TPA: glutamate--cysteine ligase, partial [Polyangia bacterium]|nr:glutamate--cysteine ligase [Polyangia bacterium]
EPFVFSIAGEDALQVTSHDVAFEGANTSFQVHLRVAPDAFAATYNAAQLAIAPALALAANSPLFLGQRLWDETRIALFRQAVDDRPEAEEDDWRSARVSFGHGWVRASAYELFAESVVQHEPLLPVLGPEDPLEIAGRGGTPTLAELRLHHGTVWRWNRAVYDGAGGGHLRIEMRALPSGPTPADMIANAALVVGLTLALRDDVDEFLSGITFGQARRNFYAAARHGARAELLWPAAPGEPARPVAVGDLVVRLLPQVEAALVRAGVAAGDVARYLGIIDARARSGQTGAAWQRRMFAHAGGPAQRERATKEVLSRYLAHADEGQPVHTWSLP